MHHKSRSRQRDEEAVRRKPIFAAFSLFTWLSASLTLTEVRHIQGARLLLVWDTCAWIARFHTCLCIPCCLHGMQPISEWTAAIKAKHELIAHALIDISLITVVMPAQKTVCSIQLTWFVCSASSWCPCIAWRFFIHRRACRWASVDHDGYAYLMLWFDYSYLHP